MLTTPTADLALVYARQVVNGAPQTVCDLTATPAGDLGLVVGPKRLTQDLTLFLAIPQGQDPFDPTRGNPLWAQVGRPISATNDDYRAMVEQAEVTFAHDQSIAAAAGFLNLDEQLDAVTGTQVARPSPNVVTVSFTATTRAGSSISATLPFIG